jgi:tetratricopeptide (TPR) repeat protein
MFRMPPGLPATCCLCWLLASATSFAQSPDATAAEALFLEGRELFSRGQVEEACPKFIESQRLDPATGTLLAVANCHEEQGQLATAWAEYTEVATRAEKEGRFDRAEIALESARALEPRLSTLNISASPELLQIPGITVRRDAVDVGTGVLNRALPIDGGRHDVEIAAPGYRSERLSILVEGERDRAVVALPLLRPEPVPPVIAVPAPQTEPRAPDMDAREAGLTGTESIGIGVGAAGLGAALAGAGFFIAALVKVDESSKYCSSDGQCTTDEGVQLRDDAVEWGNLATALSVSGAVLTAAGLTLYWMGGRDASDSSRAPAGSLQVVGAPGGAAARLEIGF